MLDHTLRGYKDDLLRPVAGHLGRISPNAITILAMVVGLAAAGAAGLQWYGAAFVLWLLNRVLDGLDGMVARVHARQSDFGGYLDSYLQRSRPARPLGRRHQCAIHTAGSHGAALPRQSEVHQHSLGSQSVRCNHHGR